MIAQNLAQTCKVLAELVSKQEQELAMLKAAREQQQESWPCSRQQGGSSRQSWPHSRQS